MAQGDQTGVAEQDVEAHAQDGVQADHHAQAHLHPGEAQKGNADAEGDVEDGKDIAIPVTKALDGGNGSIFLLFHRYTFVIPFLPNRPFGLRIRMAIKMTKAIGSRTLLPMYWAARHSPTPTTSPPTTEP